MKIIQGGKEMKDFKVTLLGVTKDPQLISTAGALGCFEEKSSAEIAREISSLSKEKKTRKEEIVLKNSFGRGHGSVGDQNHFIFSIETLPRAATLQICLPEYLAHLQQSLRRAKAEKGFYIPEPIKNSKFYKEVQYLLSRAFKYYTSRTQEGILPAEDARFILPLYTKTNIQTAGNARELSHLWKMSQTEEVPSIVKAVIGEMVSEAKKVAPYLFEDFGFNCETLAWYPSAQLYVSENPMIEDLIRCYGKDDVVLIDHSLNIPITEKMVEKAIKERNEVELANLKHIHFEFLVSMSLATLHQAIRQRTWNHTVEPIYKAVEEALRVPEDRMVIPPSIENSDFSLEYQGLHISMLNLYKRLVGGGIPRSVAIGIIPHSLKIYTLIHVNGWNAIHSIGKRTCLTAQWEIRNKARKIAKIIEEKIPALGKWSKPQCIIYGRCPEIENCGYYEKYLKSHKSE